MTNDRQSMITRLDRADTEPFTRHVPEGAMTSARIHVLLGFITAAAAVSLAQAPTAPASGRTLLAVFAHPDDETVVGPLLAHYAKEGVTVHLVLATSGDQGVTPFAGIPAGDQLAAARVKEAQCAAAALGVQPPVMLGLPDGGLADTALLATFATGLTGIITELSPDAIVTWGAEGGYGHPDHRLVGAVVTQIVQAGDTNAALYYAGFPKSALQPGVIAQLPFAAAFRPVADEYLNVRVRYDPDAAARATTALRCHVSQFAPETMEQLSAMSEQMLKGTAWLRSWNGGPSKASLFD
jgi:LmbE family N-acetylglucosaminyl deacetylase